MIIPASAGAADDDTFGVGVVRATFGSPSVFRIVCHTSQPPATSKSPASAEPKTLATGDDYRCAFGRAITENLDAIACHALGIILA